VHSEMVTVAAEVIFRMLSRLEILSLLVLFNKSLVLVNGVHAEYSNALCDTAEDVKPREEWKDVKMTERNMIAL